MPCYSTLCTSQTQHQSRTQTPFNQSGYETRLQHSLIPRPPSTSLGMGLDFNTVCTMCGVHSLLCIFLHTHGNGFNFGKTMQSPQLRWFLFLVHDVLPHGYYAFRKCFSRHVFVSSWKFSKKKYKTNRNQNKITSFTGTIIRDTTQQLRVK